MSAKPLASSSAITIHMITAPNASRLRFARFLIVGGSEVLVVVWMLFRHRPVAAGERIKQWLNKANRLPKERDSTRETRAGATAKFVGRPTLLDLRSFDDRRFKPIRPIKHGVKIGQCNFAALVPSYPIFE